MAQKIRLWEVTDGQSVREIPGDSIGLEREMQSWLASDIAMLGPDLLVIGREVMTDYGGRIDLLCMDADGNLVVVELKRGRTPRNVTAQALDYASWVQELGAADIERIAGDYLRREGGLKEAFETKFEKELPEVLNESPQSVVVAEAIDDSTERVVRYLADWGVPINVATMHCFKDRSGRQLLAQVYLAAPEVAESRVRVASRRSRAITPRQHLALAEEHGIGELFGGLWEGVRGVLRPSQASDNRVRYTCQTADGGQRTVLIAWSESGPDGAMPFIVHVDRFDEHLGMSRERLESALPKTAQESQSVRTWVGATSKEKETAIGIEGVFRTLDEVDAFIRALRQADSAPS